MRLCVLSSGSGGNTAWIEADGARVLVDAGLSWRETRRRCADAGLDLRDVTDIVLTHEHADHCFGAASIARKLGARVHATQGTFGALRDPPPAELCFPLPHDGLLLLGRALQVRAIPVPHDAVEPVAYSFEERLEGGRCIRAAVVTDLGCAPRTLARALRDLDVLVIETNHDARLLVEGPYPASLKRRVKSDLGHLSNAQAAQLIGQVLHRGLRHLVLAHLSEHNNTPSYARREAEAVLEVHESRATLHLAGQARPLPPIELDAASARSTLRPRQLALFGT
ncbi:MAG TPA: MBL fold metallo-hydrolase [Myxococcales bacterium]|nr:MBL fold metallo-hydrolase [Myxococcales bacterium]